MKNYVCDLCDAFNVGYKHFKKEFNSVRHARMLAKGIKGILPSQACDYDNMKKIKDIREESKSCYNPDWEKNSKYLKPKDL